MFYVILSKRSPHLKIGLTCFNTSTKLVAKKIETLSMIETQYYIENDLWIINNAEYIVVTYCIKNWILFRNQIGHIHRTTLYYSLSFIVIQCHSSSLDAPLLFLSKNDSRMADSAISCYWKTFRPTYVFQKISHPIFLINVSIFSDICF